MVKCRELPNVVRDPAAWGALLERERIALVATDVSDPNTTWRTFTSETPTPGEAVALAVLHKHGITPPPRPKERS